MNGKPLLKDKDKPKKKRPKSVSKLRKELDGVFSQYIRRKYSDENEYGSCYTCGHKAHWKKLQNGHLVSRYYTNTRFDEDNCRPQCYTCNMFRNGMIPDFSARIEKELGEGTTHRLYEKARITVNDYPYEEKIKEYKAKLKEYDNGKQ